MSESAIADEIGRIGESFFDFITSKTNLLIGKIDPDRMGKDRVVEAKLAPRNEKISFDNRSAPLACSIQIKTVLRTTKVVTLSLSVAERLAKDSQPAFIYIVRLDENREVFDARVIHIFDGNLAKILKRLRKEFAAGVENLHDRNITFQIKDAKRIGLKGNDLTTLLEHEIGSDMDRYAETKSKQRANLGYENGRPIRIDGSFEAAKIADFVDGLLGLRPLSLAKFTASEERFGIALPFQQFPKFQPGTLAHFNPKPVSKCTLVIGPPGDEDTVEITCDVILPPMSPIPFEHLKALLKSPFLEATFSQKTFSLRTLPEWAIGQHRSLDDWIAYSTALLTFTKGKNCPIAVRTVAGIEHLGIATMDSPLDVQQAKTQLKVLRAFREIRKESAAPAIPVKADDILDAWSEILRAQNCLSGTMPSDFSFTIRDPKEAIPEEVEFLLLSGFSVGDEHYAYGIKCRVKSEETGSDWLVRQVSPFTWMDIALLNDFEADFVRYRNRLLRLSGVEMCLSSIAYEEELMDASDIAGLGNVDLNNSP
ncbi:MULTISPECIES: hypothetical protein [unclassified Ensifer]|uniref:hypothetical protein n=1 Tax=unclassified Ensifer TaxID=2633371 RepID=UPI000813763C|nr:MULTISPECIES: hypothetical protein [unclassified Ensifer]OCP19667.1 hypothetical protein BC361_30145 [Ensifer sp. LC54]OCP19696.1 hypothetical protein BC363_30440 [Ensifer sp. LC384]